MGEMNFKRLFSSNKEETPTKKVIETSLVSNDNDEEEDEKTAKPSPKPSARSAAKKMRPKKMKK